MKVCYSNLLNEPASVMMCVSLSLPLLELFGMFDLNCDGHIDLSEMVQLVAVCCRKPEEDRHKREWSCARHVTL